MGMFDGLFNKDNEKKLKKLNSIIDEKNEKIKNLEERIEFIKKNNISSGQLEIFEKNLKTLKKENDTLKVENNDLIKKIENINANNACNESDRFTLDTFLYKLPIEEFFNGAKFIEIREFLEKRKIAFLQEFDIIKEDEEFKSLKNSSLAIEKFDNFHNDGIIAFENRVYLCKGEKISKVFKKSRKFINYLTDLNIEFMDDMKDFDFKVLEKEENFKQLLIDELSKINEEYFKIYKI